MPRRQRVKEGRDRPHGQRRERRGDERGLPRLENLGDASMKASGRVWEGGKCEGQG